MNKTKKMLFLLYNVAGVEMDMTEVTVNNNAFETNELSRPKENGLTKKVNITAKKVKTFIAGDNV